MAEKVTFPFEDAAKAGRVPDDLDFLDAGACLRLMRIFDEYKVAVRANPGEKQKAVEKARKEKAKLHQDWKHERNAADFRARVLRDTEKAVNACRLDPTPYNAIRLCNAIDGICGSAT